MKTTFIILFLGISTTLIAQKNYYTKNGVVAKGYDLVSYFNQEAKKGLKEFSFQYDGVTFYFSSKENLTTFQKNPKKYLPQYGGYCAYAMAAKGSKVSINPETFEIRQGKLFLFYNKGKVNTLTYWKEQGAEQMQQKADANWEKIQKK